MVEDDNFNMQGLMDQAQKMQEDLEKAQEEISNKFVEVSVGGGLFSATVSCKYRCSPVKVSPEVLKESPEVIGDLLKSLFNDAAVRIESTVQGYMKQFTDTFNLPDYKSE